jgi:hypothetical protein
MHATPPHSPPPVFVSSLFRKNQKGADLQQPPTTSNNQQFPIKQKTGPNNRRIDILSVFFFREKQKTIFTPSRIKIPQLIEPPWKNLQLFVPALFQLGGAILAQITSSPNNEIKRTEFG